jgi:hypothetical protein
MDPDMPSIKHGYKFVKVHLELKNEGHRPELESGLEYALLNAQGDRYAPFSDEYEPRLGNAGESWNTDTLQPGDIITGYIGFNVPPSFRAAHLRVTATASEEAEPGSWKL